MTDQKSVTFFTQSTIEAVKFPSDPPTLMIQCWAGESYQSADIYWGGAYMVVIVGDSRFGGLIRWDDEPATKANFSRSSSDKITHFRDSSQFIDRAMGHSRTLVRLYDINGAAHHASFNLTGLDDAMASHRETCEFGGKSE